MNQENNTQSFTPQFPNELNAKDMNGYPITVSSAPTFTPRNWIEGFVMYETGGTKRLYVYDFGNKAWRYATLT